MSPGATAATRRVVFGARDPDHFEAAEIDETALRRAAFVAEERARREEREKSVELAPEAIVYPAKSLRHAFVLWTLLGMFGAHRFYLRRPITGALMALLSTISLALVLAEYYPAFGGAMLVGFWTAFDGLLIQRMHRIATTGKA